MSQPRAIGLTARLTLGAALLVITSAAAVAGALVELDRRHTIRDLELRATAVARGVAARAGERFGDRAALQHLVDVAWREPDVGRLTITDLVGRTRATFESDAERFAELPPIVVPINGPIDAEGFSDPLGQVRVNVSARAARVRQGDMARRAITAAGVVAGVGVALAAALALAITAPLRRLGALIAETGAGRYGIDRLPTGGPPEVRVLGAALRDAAEAIAHREGELVEANEALRRTEAQRDTMTHMLVHDLKGPIGNLLMLIGLLEGGVKEPDDRALLGETRARCEGLLAMIGDLLVMARLEGAEVRLDRAPHIIDELVDGALSAVQTLASQRGVRVYAESPEDDDATLACDGRLIERALLNLLTNALKYGASPVHVRAMRLEGGARFEVEDAGAGLPPEVADRAFEKFAKGDAGGTGLGLAFVAMAIEAHGGEVAVDGARFTLTVPDRGPT